MRKSEDTKPTKKETNEELAQLTDVVSEAEAEVSKTQLEAEGIGANIVRDEFTGLVRLYVLKSDLAAARNILDVPEK
jgi:hypothetical protein